MKRSLEFVWLSLVVLATLVRVRRWLWRDGLRTTIDRATASLTDRHATAVVTSDAAASELRRVMREDEIISWWLVKLRVSSICLYRSLVMMRRLSQFPSVTSIEFVLGVKKTPTHPMAHSWLMLNGCEFRQSPEIWGECQVVARICREAPA